MSPSLPNPIHQTPSLTLTCPVKRLAIVYNVFSDTFMQGIGVGGAALVRLMFLMPLAYLALSLLFWKMANKLLPGIDPPTRSLPSPILFSSFLFLC